MDIQKNRVQLTRTSALFTDDGVSVTLRGDLAAFLRADAAVLSAPGNKKAALLGENGYSWEVLGSLDAGTGSHRQLRITCRA